MFRVPDHSPSPSFGGPDEPASIATLLARLPDRGASIRLDEALEIVADDADEAYRVVAGLVRDRRVVVEFEAEPIPFPYRAIVVRRL